MNLLRLIHLIALMLCLVTVSLFAEGLKVAELRASVELSSSLSDELQELHAKLTVYKGGDSSPKEFAAIKQSLYANIGSMKDKLEKLDLAIGELRLVPNTGACQYLGAGTKDLEAYEHRVGLNDIVEVSNSFDGLIAAFNLMEANGICYKNSSTICDHIGSVSVDLAPHTYVVKLGEYPAIKTDSLNVLTEQTEALVANKLCTPQSRNCKVGGTGIINLKPFDFTLIIDEKLTFGSKTQEEIIEILNRLISLGYCK